MKFLILLMLVFFCSGCYIPHPANRVGVRSLQPVERWDKVCTIKTKKNGIKETHCRKVRSR
jgi:hypothetical protein